MADQTLAQKFAYHHHLLEQKGVTLVAVSKTKPTETLQSAYDAGCRIFGENKVQEMVAKAEALPKDIQWHLIGHLQKNKIKYIAPFVSMIHGVDSWELLEAIHRQAAKNNRVIDCLLQVHIAEEETKFGFSTEDLGKSWSDQPWAEWTGIRLRGLMGMASFTEDTAQVRGEFQTLKTLFDTLSKRPDMPGRFLWDTLSMGMSGDWPIAVEEGSTMVRIGSSIFGSR